MSNLHESLYRLRMFSKQANCLVVPKLRVVFKGPSDLAHFEALLVRSMKPEEVIAQGVETQYRARRFNLVGINLALLTEDR
jgi:hypothetical protein